VTVLGSIVRCNNIPGTRHRCEEITEFPSGGGSSRMGGKCPVCEGLIKAGEGMDRNMPSMTVADGS